MPERYKFDLTFQEHLLAALLSDKDHYKAHASYIKPEYFDSEILSAIAQAANEFVEKTGSLPDVAALVHGTRAFHAPGRKPDEYKARIKSIFSRIGTNTDYYRREAVRFAKRAAVRKVLREGVVQAEEENYDELLGSLEEAIKVGENGKFEAKDYFSRARERALNYKSTDSRSGGRVTVGLPALDEATSGGIAAGELAAVMAPPKRGKSTFLVSVGAAAILRGVNVLHVSLELKSSMIEAKYDSNFLGMNALTLAKKPKTFYNSIRELHERVKSKLYVVEFPTKSVTVADIKTTVEKHKDLGLVLVDYADLIRPARAREEKRFELSELYESLRRISAQVGVPVWTATQASRPALFAKRVDMEHTAECFDKMAICDLAVSLCQTQEEVEDSKLRVYVMANRLGPSFIEVPCRVNWATSKIWEEVEEDV